MNKFVKGFLSLLVNGASFTLHMVELPGISADRSGACCNIFIYLQWLILKCWDDEVFEICFCLLGNFFFRIRKKTQFTNIYFLFSLLLVFLFTYKPVDLKNGHLILV